LGVSGAIGTSVWLAAISVPCDDAYLGKRFQKMKAMTPLTASKSATA